MLLRNELIERSGVDPFTAGVLVWEVTLGDARPADRQEWLGAPPRADRLPVHRGPRYPGAPGCLRLTRRACVSLLRSPNAAGPASPWRDRAGVVAAQPLSSDGSGDIADQLSVTRDRGPRDIP